MKKKKWALLLVLLVAFTSCGKQAESEQGEQVSIETVKQIEHQVNLETEPVATPTPIGGEGTLPQDSQGTASDETGQSGNNEGGNNTESTGISEAKDGEFEETNDTVYVAVSKLNLRSAPSTESEVVGKAVYGDSFTRLAKGSKGWDKLLYEGQVVYAYAEYLSTEKVVSVEDQKTVQELLAEAKKKQQL